MTYSDERAELEAEISERQQRLKDLQIQPMTPTEATELARSDPHTFNERFDACKRAGRSPVDYSKEK